MFPKIGEPPQIIHFNRGFPVFLPSIFGVKSPYFGFSTYLYITHLDIGSMACSNPTPIRHVENVLLDIHGRFPEKSTPRRRLGQVVDVRIFATFESTLPTLKRS